MNRSLRDPWSSLEEERESQPRNEPAPAQNERTIAAARQGVPGSNLLPNGNEFYGNGRADLDSIIRFRETPGSWIDAEDDHVVG
jgi:hypothetical protein